MHPVLGGVVVEREQLVQVVGDLGDGLGPFGAVVGFERLGSCAGVVVIGGVVDFCECLVRTWTGRLRQGGKDIGELVPLPSTT